MAGKLEIISSQGYVNLMQKNKKKKVCICVFSGKRVPQCTSSTQNVHEPKKVKRQ